MAQHEEPTQSGVSKTQLAQAMRQVEREKTRRRIGRRVLLVGAGAAACVGAVELAPKIVDGVKNELGNDFAAGIEAGRKALATELLSLEEISLDLAVDVADLTEFGVVNIVRPLANLASTIAGDALGILANAVQSGRDALGHLNINFDWLNDLSGLLQQWHQNVSQSKLGDFVATDVTVADKYLHALRDKLYQEASKPTPMPTASPTETQTPAS